MALREQMKRNRPGDELRRWAIKARRQGTPSRAITQHIGRVDTIKGYLACCRGTVEGAYHPNAAVATALFRERDVTELDAVGRLTPDRKITLTPRTPPSSSRICDFCPCEARHAERRPRAPDASMLPG